MVTKNAVFMRSVAFRKRLIIFDVRGDVVNVVGIFHQLENYPNKL